MDPESGRPPARRALATEHQGSHPRAHLALLLRAHCRPRTLQVSHQSRSHFAREAGLRVLHTIADIVLPAGLLSEHVIACRPDSVGMPQRFLLLASYLFPIKECHFWGNHWYLEGRAAEVCCWHGAQEYLWDDQRANIAVRLNTGIATECWLHRAAFPT